MHAERSEVCFPSPQYAGECLRDWEAFLLNSEQPTLITCALMHYQFEAIREDYYAALSGISERGKWIEWLTYFLNGVIRQTEDVLKMNC